ncbi:hypothetical protein [Clostridium cellulovorans]|uniref:Uncharacterized protein n=1 Tax=Clostridium cellulovorans (strain ATCC 35296 / DSM 3052 / OCM 3 / 743B) TaxID=573061 RepID=D9SV03_CLOC7|nr:hypothetical protein [Clostridium cellulovorans]ADL52978.1 hypothetical protein Clocel_3296 [Clostridium cellulovorans 743B]
MGNEKTNQLLKDFISKLPESYREMFREIAEYAISLGYTPKKTKTKEFILDFSKSKVKRTIMKLEIRDNSIKDNKPGLRLKFYANKGYSEIFNQGIQRVIEEYDGRYTGCYGCGRCKGELEGYTYTYSDGKKIFRCGSELISIHNFGPENISELKALIKGQDEFFMKNNLSKNERRN